MGRKLNLSHLSEAECEHILNVVHKDFDLRYMEKERIRRIEEDVQDEETKYTILSKSRVFNERNCICCFSRFFPFFNPRVLCDFCKFKVCKSCIEVDKETRSRGCKACLKQRQLSKQSNEWFYARVEKKFKRCGSAKVIRSLYHRHQGADDGSRSVILITHSDSDTAVAGTHRWRSVDETVSFMASDDDGTLPKSCILPCDKECNCGMSPCLQHSHSLPLEDDDKSHGDSMEEESCLRDSSASLIFTDSLRPEDDGDFKKCDRSGDVEELERMTSDTLGLEPCSAMTPIKADSSIQTEKDRELAEAGTMTLGVVEASSCFNGFDGMATVSTEGHETDPQFVIRPHNIRVLEAEPLIVECKVNGTEPLDVLWFCNRNQVHQLEESDRCEIRRHGNTFCLTLFNMGPSDSLEYLCIAVNAFGQCAQGFTVTVDANAHLLISPEFTNPSDNIEIVPEGSDAVLSCSVSAYPEPNVTWFKNNKKLVHGGRYRTERHVPSALQYNLIIAGVRAEDSGTYSATAVNAAGEAHHTLILLVQPSLYDKNRALGAAAEESPSSFPSSNEDDLLRLAQEVSITQGRYTTTATRMLRSADVMSSMQNQLDEMDRALEGLEGEVIEVISDDEDSANNNNYPILDDLDDMKSSAEAVGVVTSAALQLLSSAKAIAMETLRVGTNEQVQEVEEGELEQGEWSEEDKEEDWVEAEDLQLSYHELEKLFEVGLISRSQLKKRLVKRRNIKNIRLFLQSSVSSGMKDTPDCTASASACQSEYSAMETSTESMDIENPDNISKKKSKFDKNRKGKQSGASDAERRQKIARAATDGTDAENLLKKTEQQIYLTSGKVFSLEDCIRDLEREVQDVDESTPAEKLACLENSVAKAVAQVTQSDHEVNEIERQVELWREKSNRNLTGANQKQAPVSTSCQSLGIEDSETEINKRTNKMQEIIT